MKNKKIKFAIIGLGYFGKHYFRILSLHPNVELIAIADHSFKNIKTKKIKVPRSIKVFYEGEDVLNLPEVEAVIIATPLKSHLKLTEMALKKGKHVFLEKPFTVDLRDAKKLEKKIKISSKVFMLGHQYLYNDFIKYLKVKLDNNSLGRIKYILAENLYLGPIRRDVGCFIETATHEISILDYLFGPLNNTKISINKISLTSNKYEDFAEAKIILPNKIMATILTSWFMPQKTRKISIFGTKGVAIFDDCEKKDKLKFYLLPHPQKISNSSYFFNEKSYKIFIPKIKSNEPLKNEIDHFIDCIKSKSKPLTDIDHSVRVTRILTI